MYCKLWYANGIRKQYSASICSLHVYNSSVHGNLTNKCVVSPVVLGTVD